MITKFFAKATTTTATKTIATTVTVEKVTRKRGKAGTDTPVVTGGAGGDVPDELLVAAVTEYTRGMGNCGVV